MQIFEDIHMFPWQSMTTNNCNTYLIYAPSPVLIDPGHLHLFDHVQKELAGMGLGVSDIGLVICTHAHPDHIEGVQRFSGTGALTAIHEEEFHLVRTKRREMAAMGMETDFIQPDFLLKEGDISIQGLKFRVLHTPGHSPGSLCLYWPDRKTLFTGDLVFKEGIGRTDLPGGDGSIIKSSIKRLWDLDIEYLLPGHGEIIIGAKNVKSNFKRLEDFYFAYV